MQKRGILVVDFGSQYAQLIVRRIRELGVYCDILPFQSINDTLPADNIAGVILSGGPESVLQANAPKIPSIILQLEVPLLGICYGMQALALQLGGEVIKGQRRELGFAAVKITQPSLLLSHLQAEASVLDTWMSHGDHVSKLPPGFIRVAETSDSFVSAMENTALSYFGLQFHPEVVQTKLGEKILQRFAMEICKCEMNWTTANIIQQQIEKICYQVGNKKIILALSGGVDSSVAAILLHKALGAQLVCIFVDTGLLRQHEVQEVQDTFAQHFGLNLITVDASERFYLALSGVDDPEQKRKIIGKLFIDVFREQALAQSNIEFLAQGTIYSDVIESAANYGSNAHTIKSHHNVGGLPKDLPFALVEPLRELFKDEVRALGIALGLAPELINRHPFPGPGLGVRVLGEVKAKYVDILRQADAIFIDELKQANLYHKLSQAFAVYLPIKSVGVVGDARQYEHIIALRAVETVDFMTAEWAQLPYELLAKISARITNEVAGISRVVYDISGKPPATIEWE